MIQEQPHWEVPANCSSPCIYVRESEVQMLMTGPVLSTTASGSTTASSSGGRIVRGAGMDKINAIMQAQKYCFKPSNTTQSMCHAHYDNQGKELESECFLRDLYNNCPFIVSPLIQDACMTNLLPLPYVVTYQFDYNGCTTTNESVDPGNSRCNYKGACLVNE